MSWLTIYLVVYGVLALSHLAVQMLLAHLEYLRQRRATYPENYRPSVSIVVPAYNEEPELLYECLRSLDRQEYDDYEVLVVDDGSRNLEELIPIKEEFSPPKFRIFVGAPNMGKRHVQAVAFEQATGEVIVTVDSDTVLMPDSLRTIVRRFSDPEVGAVSGDVRVRNAPKNLLTRLIGYRYWSAFNQERAAQSYFKVVMCASGPFSAYRRTIIDQVRERYIGQRFLGEACTFGDDRHLTNLVLELGYGVVFDKDALAYTNVPEDMPAYLRQQTRWNKSFYREILWTVKFARRHHAYLSIDLALQTFLPFMLLFALGAMVGQAVFADVSHALWYLGVLVAIGFLRSLYGLYRERDPGFLLFMVYGFIHVGLLIPTRLYALATIRRGHWGTRTRPEARPKTTVLAESDLGRGDFEALLARASGVGGVVLALDLDGFREITLRHGHRAGERVVHAVADAIRDRTGRFGTVRRIGGDEFGVLLAGADVDRGRETARALLEAVTAVNAGAQEEHLSASVGLSPFAPDEDGDPLVRAEFAMHQAKAAGRQTVREIHVADWNDEAERSARWAARIRDALDHDAFYLLAQPIRNIRSRRVEHWDLSVRLQQEGEVIPASAFMPTAERFGLVSHVDRWLVRQAAAILAGREDGTEIAALHVSLSASAIGDPLVLEALRAGLDDDRLHPWDIVVAVDLDAVVADVDRAARFAAEVRDLGCRFAVGGFSTGHEPSRELLTRLLPDFARISDELVRSLGSSSGDERRLATIAALARDVGHQTIAFGVGDDRVLAVLEDLGIDHAAGFYIGRPAPLAQILGARDRTAPGVRPEPRRATARLGEAVVLDAAHTTLRVAALPPTVPASRDGQAAVDLEVENLGRVPYTDALDRCIVLLAGDDRHPPRSMRWAGDGARAETGDSPRRRVVIGPGERARWTFAFGGEGDLQGGRVRFTPDSGFGSDVAEWAVAGDRDPAGGGSASDRKGMEWQRAS